MSRILVNLVRQVEKFVSKKDIYFKRFLKTYVFQAVPVCKSNSRRFSLSARILSPWPQVQKPAPDFAGTAVVNGDFKDIKLSDYKGKYVVLFFYPLDL